jgi:hypothetical protein
MQGKLIQAYCKVILRLKQRTDSVVANIYPDLENKVKSVRLLQEACVGQLQWLFEKLNSYQF